MSAFLYYIELLLLKEIYDMAGLATIFWIAIILGVVRLALKGDRK